MPQTSARVKIEAVQAYGGQVDLIDVHTISRAERVAQLLAEQPAAFQAPAYDDYRVVAGNSTLGQEIAGAACGRRLTDESQTARQGLPRGRD